MTKVTEKKMQSQIATLIKANAKLQSDYEALKLEVEILKPAGGEGGASSQDMVRARLCYESGDMPGMFKHLLGT